MQPHTASASTRYLFQVLVEIRAAYNSLILRRDKIRMKVKILFSVIVLLIVVCVLAVGSLVYFIDPDKLKPVIIEQVKSETGYELSMEGNLSWSFYPRVAVKVDRMILRAPNEAQPFFDGRDISIAADLAELLRAREKLKGDIAIGSVRLININANNITATLNWENNVLILNPIKAQLYQGTLEGLANGRDFSSSVKWQWDMKCTDIQLKPLLQDVNGQDSKIKIAGAGSLNYRVKHVAIAENKC